MGNRIVKVVKPRTEGQVVDEDEWMVTYYVRDANGEVMAVYEEEYSRYLAIPGGWLHRLYLVEHHIYGSSRIGMVSDRKLVSQRIFTSPGFTEEGKFNGRHYQDNENLEYIPSMNPRFQVIGSSNEVEVTSGRIRHAVGRKRYELTNHLGNVLTVISDRRIAADNVSYEASPTGTYSPAPGTPGLYHAFISGTTTYAQTIGTDGIIDYYTAEIISSSEYSAFGVQLQDWGYQSEAYRYGFQNQEHDNELWSGAVSYKYRVEDPRLGRFFSVDPLAAKYPHNSVYAFSENRVLDAIELEGLEAYFIHGTQTPWGKDYRKYVHGEQMDIEVLKGIGETFGNKTTNQAFNWNGCNFDHCRHDAASALAEHILKSRVSGEPITLVGHSHGGNVAIEAANILIRDHNIKSTEINIVCINTPAEEDIVLNHNSVTMAAVNAADDIVQVFGSDYDFDQTVRNADLVIEYEDAHKGDFTDHYGISTENYGIWGPELSAKLRKMNENRKPNDLDKVEIKVEEPKDKTDTKWTKK